MSLRESLVEEAEKAKEKVKNWETTARRVLANLFFILLLLGSAFLVVKVVERSMVKSTSWLRQNEITIVMSLISLIMPMLFDLVALLEAYHPRKAMRLMLGRIMVLNLLRYCIERNICEHFIRFPLFNHSILFTNIHYKIVSSLYTLIFALFGKTETMSDELQKMKTMSDAGANYGLDLGTSTIAPPQKDCFVIPVPCPLLSRYFDTQNRTTSAR